MIMMIDKDNDDDVNEEDNHYFNWDIYSFDDAEQDMIITDIITSMQLLFFSQIAAFVIWEYRHGNPPYLGGNSNWIGARRRQGRQIHIKYVI